MVDQQRKKILIVDDEEEIRDSLAFCLERKGHMVIQAQSGSAALRVAELERPDLILSDVRMPDGDGVFLLKELRKIHSFYPPFIFITGFADLSLTQAFELNAEAVFPKPFDLRQLQLVIQFIVEQRSGSEFSSRSARITVDVPIEIKFEGEVKPVRGQVVNIANGGMFVCVDNALLVSGKFCEFSLESTDQQVSKVHGNGRVCWVRSSDEGAGSSGCGIEFSYADNEEKAPILEFVNYLKTKCFAKRF